jgi:hypothetical protein
MVVDWVDILGARGSTHVSYELAIYSLFILSSSFFFSILHTLRHFHPGVALLCDMKYNVSMRGRVKVCWVLWSWKSICTITLHTTRTTHTLHLFFTQNASLTYNACTETHCMVLGSPVWLCGTCEVVFAWSTEKGIGQLLNSWNSDIKMIECKRIALHGMWAEWLHVYERVILDIRCVLLKKKMPSWLF